MSNKAITTWTIFYSWQSDSTPETNLTAIRVALRDVANSLELSNTSIKIVLDEATRDTPGSPNIPSTIFDKIQSCDIFIADITTINSHDTPGTRKTPNPNVLIELGFAIATLGWERIILLFNKHHGDFPKDLPFDIDRHRIGDYKVSKASDTSGKAKLKKLLDAATEVIIEKKPLKPSEKRALSPIARKRKNDVDNLTWLMKAISIPFMDYYLEKMPRSLDTRILHFWEGFRGVLESNLFSLYDKKAQKLIDKFFMHWENTLSKDNRYRGTNDFNTQVFGHRSNQFLDKVDILAEEADLRYLQTERDSLEKAFKALLKYLRTDYLEIDLEETSKYAAEEFSDFRKVIS